LAEDDEAFRMFSATSTCVHERADDHTKRPEVAVWISDLRQKRARVAAGDTTGSSSTLARTETSELKALDRCISRLAIEPGGNRDRTRKPPNDP
jgi:hypothetical protein